MKVNNLLTAIALFLCLPLTALAQGNNTGMGGDDDDTPVSRTDDLQRAIAMLARLVAEEVDDRQIEEDRNSQEDVAKRTFCKESNEGIQPDKSDSKANEWAAPFFVK